MARQRHRLQKSAYPVYLAVCTAMAILAMLSHRLRVTLPFEPSRDLCDRPSRPLSRQCFLNQHHGQRHRRRRRRLTLVPLVGLEWTLRIGALLVALASLRRHSLGLSQWVRARYQRRGTRPSSLSLFLHGTHCSSHSGLYRSLEHEVGSVEHFRATSGKIDFLFEEDDEEATVSVIENANGHRLLRVNGKSDAGNHRDVPTQVLVGQLPFFFHADAKRVLVVGLGSGITVGSVLTHPVEHVDVVEISPAIVNGSRFRRVEPRPLDDPRVTLHVRDARNSRVLPEDVKYDVIVSEPSNPWQPGSAALFSQGITSSSRGLARRRQERMGAHVRDG